jgi:REP element-mobilizing transposase RayT
VKVLGDVRKRYEFALVGFVVMPEHVHLLIGEPKKGNPSKVIQALKQSVSRILRSKTRGRVRRISCGWDLRLRRSIRICGSGAFMISMCGVTRKNWKSCGICILTR